MDFQEFLYQKYSEKFGNGDETYDNAINWIETLSDTEMVGYGRECAGENIAKIKADMYLFLVKLENSINNAGHEERRSKDIESLWKKKKELLEDKLVEQYLP